MDREIVVSIMMALLSPHVARPRWARRSGQTKLVSEGEHLGLLGPRDREASIETISLAVSGVTDREEEAEQPATGPEKRQMANNRLELRQKVVTCPETFI